MQDKNHSSKNELYNLLSTFDFHLPADLIAQHPSDKRDESRLMVYDRKPGKIHHDVFRNIFKYLPERLLMVFNDTKVIPASIEGVKVRTGRVFDLLFYKKITENQYYALAKKMKTFLDTDEIIIGREPSIILKVRNLGDRLLLSFDDAKLFWNILERYGRPPLPPYIKRRKQNKESDIKKDKERYQTVYARHSGSVAAPTAGLHFSEEMMRRIAESDKIETAFVTLDISLATFSPVRSDNISHHKMDSETVTLDDENADRIKRAKKDNIPVVAVGTTTLKSLEGIYDKVKDIQAFSGGIDLFIRPPFTFSIADHLITNFHLPKSTLLMLVSAFAGLESVKECYKEAIDRKYRFFSYGDAMLFL